MTRPLREKRAVRQAPCHSTEYQKTVNNVTNEAFNSNPCIEVYDGYPVEYSCLGDITNTSLVAPLIVYFNYEVWIADSGRTLGIVENIRALEWSILFNVAVSISLDTCKLTNQHITRRLSTGANYISRLRKLQDDMPKVVYLSSQQSDLLNLRTASCDVQPTTANTICVPVKGSMTADYTGNDPFVIDRFLKGIISKEMSRKTILVGDIAGVRYLESSNSSQALTPQHSQSDLSGVTVGVTTVAVTVLVLALFVFVRKRTIAKQGNAVNREVLEPINDELDRSEDLSSNQADKAVVDESTTEVITSPTDPSDATTESPEPDGESRAISSRPKLTRKKKKKKKQKIVRVSSRTSISEMETIAEELEETGEASTYCGTEESSVEFQPHDPWISAPDERTRIEPTTRSNRAVSNESARLPPSPIVEERKIQRLPPPWV